MNATYGTVKPSVINIETDVEIFYHYRPSRSAEDTEFRKFRQLLIERVLLLVLKKLMAMFLIYMMILMTSFMVR